MSTIVDVLAAHAATEPDVLCARFVDAHDVASELTFAAAWDLAARWASQLAEAGVRQDDTVVLSLHNEPDLMAAYFGTLLAGAVPVPVAPVAKADADDPRQRMVAERLAFLGSRHLVVPRGAPELVRASAAAAPADTTILTGDRLTPGRRSARAGGPPPHCDPDALGLIQFSSGTAGTAKAVELTNRALLQQVRTLSEAIGTGAGDSALSWLPFFHDMGLIGFLLTPLYAARPVTILRTETFLRNPRSWPRAITRYRPTVTGGPPSAYGLVARFVREAERGDYDLSSLRLALVAAETIEPSVLEAFAGRFASSGLRSEALTPAYGLAENALAVTVAPPDQPYRAETIDAALLRTERRAVPVDGSAGRPVTSVGSPVPETEVAIADEVGGHVRDRRVGEILVRSGSLMRGYRGDVASAVRDGWLWTGDMGYLDEHDLFITGRSKELIIVAGANYDPADLERVAGSVRGVRQGRAVAFSVASAELSTETVVVLVETAIKDAAKRDLLKLEVRRALVAHDLPINAVVLVPPHSIRATDTGKVKRVDAQERYLAGELDGAG